MKNEIKDLKLEKNVLKNYTLVEGDFETNEALDVIKSLFDSKINYHKIQKMSKWSRNSNDKAEYDTTRIEQLIKDRAHFLELLKSVQGENKKIKMHSVLQIVEVK
jgi:hypothetical protein